MFILFLIVSVICFTVASELSLILIKIILFISLPILFFIYASQALEKIR